MFRVGVWIRRLSQLDIDKDKTNKQTKNRKCEVNELSKLKYLYTEELLGRLPSIERF